jgi:hypothetical protein
MQAASNNKLYPITVDKRTLDLARQSLLAHADEFRAEAIRSNRASVQAIALADAKRFNDAAQELQDAMDTAEDAGTVLPFVVDDALRPLPAPPEPATQPRRPRPEPTQTKSGRCPCDRHAIRDMNNRLRHVGRPTHWALCPQDTPPEPAPARRDPLGCPYCHRMMSTREATEQGACNDCFA